MRAPYALVYLAETQKVGTKYYLIGLQLGMLRCEHFSVGKLRKPPFLIS